MAGYTGRALSLSHEATPGGGTYTLIAGAKNHEITVNSSIVDSTTKDDDGIRTLLNAKVLTSVSVNIDGIAVDSATLKFLRDNCDAGTALNYRVTTAGDSTAGVTYTGAFHVTSFVERGAHDGLQEFAATLESSGTITIAALT